MKSNKFKVDVGAKLIEYWDEHWYKVGEDYFPSVSSILNVVAKGYQYEEWLKSAGQNADHIRDKAAVSGTKIHDAVERLICGEELRAYNESDESSYTWTEWKKINQWYNWYKEMGFTPMYVEQIVYSKSLKCAGTVDFIAKKDGVIYLLDWKSGGQWSSHAKQVSAYRRMAEETLGIEAQFCGSVYIGSAIRTKKGMNAPGIKTDLIDFNANYAAFLNAVQLWGSENPNARPRANTYPLSIKLEGGTL